MMRSSLLLLLGLAGASAQADALTDFTAKLKTLQVSTEVKGNLDASYEEFDAKGVADKSKGAHLQFEVEGGEGLSIHFGPALVQTLSAEEAANAADPDKPTPNADLLRQMNPLRIQHMFSAADNLLHDLDGASSPVVTPSTLAGASTVLSVNIPFRAPKRDSDTAKDWQDTLTVWLDAQGMPLQFKDKIHGKFCKFFLCVTVDETYSDTLRMIDGRLVITDMTLEHQQSGLGQDNHTKTTATLQLQ